MAMFVTGPGSPFPVGTNPVSNATADLNGDGHLDLLTANYISDNVTVLLGNGNAGFVAGTPVAVTNGPREIEVADLDGDGDIDFLATNYSGNNVTVGLNNGNGTFVTSSVPVGTVPRGLNRADLDGDGDIDFVAANYNSNNLSVMLNNGNGTFASATGSPIPVGTRPVAIAIGNFDGENGLDIAVTSNNTNTVSILLNDGDGTFTAAAPAATGSGPRGIATGDLDGDGDSDLVVANFGATSISILRNNGSGVFTAFGAPLTTGNNPYAVQVGDLDGDGDRDIAVTNSGSSSISVFRNNGSGSFAPASGSPFGVGVSPGGVVFGDFDEDGDFDLATANFGSNTTSILLNAAASYTVNSTPTQLEGTSAGTGGELVFVIKRTATSHAENVTYTLGGTAAGSDYTAPSGTVHFAIGQAAAVVRIDIKPDATFEPNETVVLSLADAIGEGSFIAGQRSAVGTIVNDDPKLILGTSGNNTLNGTPGADIIKGFAGDDRINAGGGGDEIIGGIGVDIMNGGTGADTFSFLAVQDSAPNEPGIISGSFNPLQGQGDRDIITDFAGLDRIDLSAIDAKTTLAGNQAFTWRGLGDFTNVAGQLLYRTFNAVGTVNDKTIIYGDTNGDGLANFQIELKGIKTLTAADFVL